jgi:anti-sigma B factor antagonist
MDDHRVLEQRPDLQPTPHAPPAYGQFNLSSEREGEVHGIHLFGELDLASAHYVEDELTRAEGTDARLIVLDLSGLQYLDSTGVQLLLSAHARSRADRDRLKLLRGTAEVQRVFELCGVDDVLPFAD